MKSRQMHIIFLQGALFAARLSVLCIVLVASFAAPAFSQISIAPTTPPIAFAGIDIPPVVLLLEPERDTFHDKNYGYRKIYHEKTIAIMLYGFQTGTAQKADNAIIPKDRKKLNAFFKQHLERAKRDYLGDEASNTVRIMTGQPAFTSAQINRGMEGETAKMAGLTLPMGRFTVGGGYIWGENNPALMLPTADGIFAGFSYDTGKLGFQASYLMSGQRIIGWKVGDGDYRYNSIMLGTSFRVNKRMALTATLQHRNDDDPLTTGDRQTIVTVGTRWRF